jgi:hypothetical protein
MLKVFLLGDNTLPKDPDMLIAALETAYFEIANDCTALKLLTVTKDKAILRTGPGSTFVRMPDTPKSEEDELDIDSELVPAVARIMASYIARDMQAKQYHKMEAAKIINQYESKVRTYLDKYAGDMVYT